MKLFVCLFAAAVVGPGWPTAKAESVRAALGRSGLNSTVVIHPDLHVDTSPSNMHAGSSHPTVRLYPEDTDRSYKATRAYCEDQGKVLCSFDQICPKGKKGDVFGSAIDPNQGDQWIAFEGDGMASSGCRGEAGLWLQIAGKNETWKDCLQIQCPAWGSDASNQDDFHKFVACCDRVDEEKSNEMDGLEARLGEIESKTAMLQTTDFERQSLRDRVKTVELVAETLKDVRQELATIDTGGFEVFDRARDMSRKQIDAGLHEMSKVIKLMESAVEGNLDESAAEEILNGQDHRVASASRKLLQQEQREAAGDFSEPKTPRPSARFEAHARAKSHFSVDRAASSMHSKLSSMGEAILNGNTAHVERKLVGRLGLHNVESSRHGRRMEATNVDALRRAKGRQCRILASCVGQMSLYDVFISFYADDIDTTTGKVDKDVHHFDEKDRLDEKHKKAKELAKKILGACPQDVQECSDGSEVSRNPDNGCEFDECPAVACTMDVQLCFDDLYVGRDPENNCEFFPCPDPLMADPDPLVVDPDPVMAGLVPPVMVDDLALGGNSDCNRLLELFHRTIEKGDIPYWEGSTVSEVCLAEGTPKYVGLGDIAGVVGGKIAKEVAEEQLNCAWDLYNSPARNSDPTWKWEPFVFADEKQHAPATRLKLDDLLVPTEIASAARDASGKIKSSKTRSPTMRLFANKKYMHPDLSGGLSAKEKKKKVKEHYDGIQKGFEMVFGEKQSVGMICGIKESITKHAKSMPGHCCLDAPFENNGDDWGRKHDCRKKCKNPGPFFAGFSDEACKSHGGTWCQNPVNCGVLKACVEAEIKTGTDDDKPAYVKFVESGRIGNPLDAVDCGRSREYFGYDAHYNHDADICENIQQLKNTRNFQDLEKFFGDNTSVKEPVESKESKEIKSGSFSGTLTAPKRDKSSTVPVTGDVAWESANFAIEQVLDIAWVAAEAVANLDCGDDGAPGAVVWNICIGIKYVIYIVALAVYQLLKTGLAISDFTRGQLCTPSSPENYEVWENTGAIYKNMETTFDFLDHIYKTVTENQKTLSETLTYVSDRLDAIPATKKVTRRPTPQPTGKPTSMPTKAPVSKAPTPNPTQPKTPAPKPKTKGCQAVYPEGLIVGSEWVSVPAYRGKCDLKNPCIARVGGDGLFYMGDPGTTDGPGKQFTSSYFRAVSKADTKKLFCGETISAEDSHTRPTMKITDKGNKITMDEFTFTRLCEPIYEVEDITAYYWDFDAWQGVVEAKVDHLDRLWMGVRTGQPNGYVHTYPKVGAWHTKSALETRKLRCGLRTTVVWDQSADKEVTMTKPNTIVSHLHGDFKRTNSKLKPDLFTFGSMTTSFRTYNEAVGFCKKQGLDLASKKDICPRGGNSPPYSGQRKGDQWVPFSDTYNGWLQAGEGHANRNAICTTHEHLFGVKPTWGTSTNKEDWEGNFVFCKTSTLKRFDRTTGVKDWEGANKFCEGKGMKLASSKDYCAAGQVFGGRVKGDQWAAISDNIRGKADHNWVQVGDGDGKAGYETGKTWRDPHFGWDGWANPYENIIILCKAK